ncbi:MAG: HD domain-containing protein [Dehalococcoidales bacterium]|nr:HD domain-containing protein [Dehalococcoidales bacterium]
MDVPRERIAQVLVLDRDPVSMQVLGGSLRQSGFGVTAVSTMSEALDAIANEELDLILMDPFPPGLQGMQLLDRLRPAEQNRQIPVILLVDKEYEERLLLSFSGSLNHITRPFDPGRIVGYVKSFLPDLPYYTDVDPLTELPGPRWAEHELQVRMSQRKPFALVNVDIDSLRPFRKVYGSFQADAAIRLVARILSKAVKFFGNDDDLVGHVGDDDFYVISSPDRVRAICQSIVSSFDDSIKDLYVQKDILRGYLECEYPPGCVAKHPLMTLSVGVTTSANHEAKDSLVVKRVAREMNEYAKTAQSSAYRIDRRTNDLMQDGRLGRAGRQGTMATPTRSVAQTKPEGADFAYHIASQLRVPVTVMQSTLDYLIQTTQTNLTREQTHHLDVLLKHTRTLSDMISQLAAFHEVSHGSAQIHLEIVDLVAVLGQVIGLVDDTAKTKGIHLQIRGTQKIDRVLTDENILCQILLYTLCSVVEYASSGTAIEINVSETNSQARITLAIGDHRLSARELVKAFRSFYSPKQLAAPNHGNLGLGLGLAKSLLRNIGGTFSVGHRDQVYICLDFPKKWQSIEAEARAIQEELTKVQMQVKSELARAEAIFAGLDEIPVGLGAVVDSIGSCFEHLGLEANRAVFLADDALGRLSRERERSGALDASFLAFLEAAAELVEHRDWYFAGHSRRVAAEAFSIGQELRLSEEELHTLYIAGLLHDIGMVAVPDHILSKTEELNNGELLVIRQHPIVGSRCIATVDALSPISQCVLHHHERYDGEGYPLGLRGERTPLASRILAVADAYDAMTSSRQHRPPSPPEEALQKTVNGTKTQFDPRVVEAFLRLHASERAV